MKTTAQLLQVHSESLSEITTILLDPLDDDAKRAAIAEWLAGRRTTAMERINSTVDRPCMTCSRLACSIGSQHCNLCLVLHLKAFRAATRT